MERPNLASLRAQKREAASFYLRALKDRLRIEADFLRLQQEIEAARRDVLSDGHAPSNGHAAPNGHDLSGGDAAD